MPAEAGPQALDSAEQVRKVAQVTPHELRAEDAVRGRSLLERPVEVAAIVAGVPEGVRGPHDPVGHLAEGEALDDVRMTLAIEVLVRPPRHAGMAQRFEILLGMASDAGLIEELAQQRAPAAGRRADEVRQRRHR